MLQTVLEGGLEPPPRQMNSRMRRIRQRVYDQLVIEGRWDSGHALLLNGLAFAADGYLGLREKIRTASPNTTPELLAEGLEARETALKFMAEFLLIDPRRAHLGEVNDAGDDVLIVALAAP